MRMTASAEVGSAAMALSDAKEPKEWPTKTIDLAWMEEL